MTLQEAVQWCIQRSARVKFGIDYYPNRVEVRIGGYPPVERDSLEEAVETLIKKVAERVR